MSSTLGVITTLGLKRKAKMKRRIEQWNDEVLNGESDDRDGSGTANREVA